MSAYQHKALVRRFYDAFNQGNSEAMDSILATDWVNHPASPGRPNSPDGFKAGMQDFHRAFPAFNMIREALVVEDDLVVCRVSMTGRHVGALGDWLPSGEDETLYAMDMHRIANDKIAETWHFERLATHH